MPYSIKFHEKVNKDIEKLPKNMQEKIINAIVVRLGTDPVRFGKRLAKSLAGLWRMRFGDYSVVYYIKENEVQVLAIRHRKEVYNIAERRLLH